jgi:aqualysin 1
MTARRALIALVCLGVVSLGAPASASHAVSARLIHHLGALQGRYIVVLRSDARDARPTSMSLAARFGGHVRRVFGAALDGYAATMTAPQAERLSHDPRVAYVEEDTAVRVDATQSPAAWNLDRLDQQSLPLDGSYTYGSDGAGVTAYVIDTGVRASHVEFGGRASTGVDVVDGGLADDCNGHGTHVAGTIGGSTFGVAKAVDIVAVRVLDCQGTGTISDVIAGIDWISQDHQAGVPAVANMSLGGPSSRSLDAAVAGSIADGIVYAVAAGNGDGSGGPVDACTTSPGGTPAAITVSATDANDVRPSWANIGACVDLFAPGVSVMSAWSSSDGATKTISGTSMATPHVAGVAATYLSSHASAMPAEVAAAIVDGATTGVVVSAGAGSPNRMLFVGATGSSPSPPPAPSTSPSPPPPPSSSLSLSVAGRISRHGERVRLRWTGASTASVDVIRNGTIRFTTANDRASRDDLRWRDGRFRYRVCEAGAAVCSNVATVRF